ncbi:formimidoylglutamase [Halomarina litorea]|uniref:formimidoylglutamase n=1 Tax=Halomarina litorea TaxID=2961595 RepID=UPI0020C56CD7|nr:formimidoylglutamase [Halomarina sp. BCD28]
MAGAFTTADFDWVGTSTDPNDEQFGDVVEHTTPRDAAGYDALLVGEPYDGAVIGRRGASEGPHALRAALAGSKTHHFWAGPARGIGDLGDVAALDDSHETVRETQRAVREAAERVHALDALPVFLGGDNSLTYPNAAPLLDRGSLGVVNLDAHLDVREVRGDATSGTPYRQLFEVGLDAYACLGARHFETSTRYHEFVEDRGGTVLTAGSVGADLDGAVERVREAMADVEHVYVSVDLDVLDAAHAPGVSAPTPGGLTTRELFRLLSRLARAHRIAGFEVVECAPPRDREDLTARAGARAIAHFLSGYAEGEGQC